MTRRPFALLRFAFLFVVMVCHACQPDKDYYKFVNNTGADLSFVAHFDPTIVKPSDATIASATIKAGQSFSAMYALYKIGNRDADIIVSWSEIGHSENQKTQTLNYEPSSQSRDHTVTFQADGALGYSVQDADR